MVERAQRYAELLELVDDWTHGLADHLRAVSLVGQGEGRSEDIPPVPPTDRIKELVEGIETLARPAVGEAARGVQDAIRTLAKHAQDAASGGAPLDVGTWNRARANLSESRDRFAAAAGADVGV